MRIINALVYTPEGTFEEREVCTKGDRIAKESSDGLVVDAAGCFLIPGLTDIHFHGCMGYDFCEAGHEAFEAIGVYQAFRGITTMVPATMTLSEEKLMGICQAAATYPGSRGAALVGIDMEGPFLNAERKGSQNPAYIHKPDAALFRRLNKAAKGMIRIVTVAPEIDGAKTFIRELKDEVILSLAHTNADYDTASAAFAQGVRHVTHLYNAMTGLSHRHPGLVGAAADDDRVHVELICDGVHIHPAVVRQTFKMFGDDRIIMISDSMEATGMPDGRYTLGGQTVFKKGNVARLSDGTIAGSVTNLMDCLRIAVKDMGIPLESAVKCSAVNPAKEVGIYDRYGSIEAGKTANMVLLSQEDLCTVQVILRGETCLKEDTHIRVEG